MWILWKLRFWKCDFCKKKKCDWKFAILKMWILWKLWFWKCYFCEKCDFENVNFANNAILKQCISWIIWFLICEFLDKMWILPQCEMLSKYCELWVKTPHDSCWKNSSRKGFLMKCWILSGTCSNHCVRYRFLNFKLLLTYHWRRWKKNVLSITPDWVSISFITEP